MTGGLAQRTLPSMPTTTTEHPTIAPITTTLPRSAIDIGTDPAASRDSSIWTATRVIALALTVLETLLLARFALLLFGANASQPLVSFVYGITGPLVRPFQGIFGQPEGPPTLDIAAVLAIMFFLLLGALIVAGVRAVTGRRAGPRPTG
jgi:uncharacterized protein YggT (Ycf19 family)